MILMALYAVQAADFTFLVNVTELTDGNLSSHLSKLEAAGYVDVEKSFVVRRSMPTVLRWAKPWVTCRGNPDRWIELPTDIAH
jgi:DNA-binding transcriptional ArsR family regulator